MANEIIVVDNQGSGGARFAGDSSTQVVYVRQSANRGFAEACNRGVEASRGDYLLFLNSDAWFRDTESVQVLVDLFREQRLGAAAPRLLNPDGRYQYSAGPFPTVANLSLRAVLPKARRGYYLRAIKRCQNVDWASGASLLVRRDAFEKVGGFDERFFFNLEDVDLCLRLRQCGYETIYYAKVEAFHVGGASISQEVEERIAREKRRSQLIYFAKHNGEFEFEFVRMMNRIFCVLEAAKDRSPGRLFWMDLAGKLSSGSRKDWLSAGELF